MLLTVDRPEVQSNVEDEGVCLSIDSESYVIFESLRKNIYSNPIEAIAREVISNCVDAQISNGNPNIPLRITFPGDYVIFQDFGTGISESIMRDVVCCYGKSTKRDSANLIGAWGMGFKVPWSYSDMFLVETVFDGYHYTYSFYIDESLRGKMVLMDKRLTKLPTGTVVKIPVKNQDRHTFIQAIKNVTRFFKVQPDFPGYPKEETVLPVLESDTWAIYLKPTGNCNVLVGELPYYVSEHSIPNRVILKFSIGQVDMTLDRSKLRMSERTNLAIKNSLEIYNREVLQKVQDQINTIESFGEVIQIIESLPSPHMPQRSYTWKGQTFNYPFDQKITCFSSGYRSLSSYNTTYCNDSVSDRNFILMDKPDEKFSSYDRARINSLLKNTSGLNYVYILPADHALPIKPQTLTSIKVIKSNSLTLGPVGTKLPKIYIKGRTYRYKRMDNQLIKATAPIAYVLTDIERAGYGIKNFPIKVVQINPKDEKYIIGEANWFKLDDYLQKELYSKVTQLEIQEIANAIQAWSDYEKFNFLKSVHADFKFLDRAPIEKKYSDTIRSLVKWLMNSKEVTPKTPDIYKKYPLLSHLSYIYGSAEKDIIEYIKLVNNNRGTAPEGLAHVA